MYPKGTGAAYDVNNNNKLKFKGQAGQCKYCKLVLILKESIRFRADNKRAVLEKIELL